ncbi:hypothetical protein VNO80_26876 [Phaseolus coccineus]|uniref:Uncharacterized protein n=1 Tax=Phaseolus coccineus TaxID=3886 RepID=A0AAN9QEV5_PHACN
MSLQRTVHVLTHRATPEITGSMLNETGTMAWLALTPLIKILSENYVQEVLQFHPENMRNFGALEEYAEALRRTEIGVSFLEVPAAKIFLAKYCKEFLQAEPLYKIEGFGFGCPFLPGVNKAILDLLETSKVRELENKMLASEECEDTELNGETASLSPNSFWVLFILTACRHINIFSLGFRFP